MSSRVNVWFMLRKPTAAVRVVLDEPSRDTTVLPVLLGGMVLVSLYADLMNLGRQYLTGQIMSVVLIVGVVTGLVICFLAPAIGLLLGNAMDRRHRVAFVRHLHIPAFPLKNLVWKRLLGAERLRAAFSVPVMRQWLMAWSTVVNAVQWLRQSLGGGLVGYERLFAGFGKFSKVFAPAALMAGLVLFTMNSPGFGGDSASSAWQWLGLAVEVTALIFFGILWIAFLREAFAIGWGKAVVAGLGSILGSLGVMVAALAWLTDIKWM
ncbi:MAG: hypothetical protein U0176_02250 [Bacteroidia bacterium]